MNRLRPKIIRAPFLLLVSLWEPLQMLAEEFMDDLSAELQSKHDNMTIINPMKTMLVFCD